MSTSNSSKANAILSAVLTMVVIGAAMVLAIPNQAWAQTEGELQGIAGKSLVAQEITDSHGDEVFVDDIPSHDYTGFPIEPAVKVENWDDELLVEGTDYTVSYSNNINAGTAVAIITGMGQYQGTIRRAFDIDSVCMWDVAWSDLGSFDYTGKAITPKPKLTLGAYELQEGQDYVLSYDDNVDAGQAFVTARAIGSNFSYSEWKTFTIDPIPISRATLAIADQLYNHGLAIQPDLTTATFNDTQLESYSDYVVSYVNNSNAGTATAVVSGRNNFKGTKNVKFTIKKAANTLNGYYITKKVSASKLKKKAQVGGVITKTSGYGKLTFKKKSGSSFLTVNKKTGKVTVKKRTKKGAYPITVVVKVAGNKNYKAQSKAVSMIVNVV